jgi:hypothetical protein
MEPVETMIRNFLVSRGTEAMSQLDARLGCPILNMLHDREVSWAMIGQALAVSRPAAWKRFG